LVTLLGSTISYVPDFAILSGLLIGIGQWAILRTKLQRTWLWIPATAIGIPLGLLIGTIDFIAIEWTVDFPYLWTSYFFIAGVAGAITGVLQWLALYRKLEGSSRWTFISAVSWGIGVTATFYFFDTHGSSIDFEFGNQIGRGILIGILVGAISGAFVESMLVNPHPRHESI